jgi:hypothetical protein
MGETSIGDVIGGPRVVTTELALFYVRAFAFFDSAGDLVTND